MEIEFSHLLLLLLFGRLPMTYCVPRTAVCLLLQRLASWCCSSVVSDDEPPFRSWEHALRLCIITEDSKLVAIASLYLRRLTEQLPC